MAHAGLIEYVNQPDETFSWEIEEQQNSTEGTVYGLKLISQVWQGITWEHQLRVYEPLELKYPEMMLLLITGGSQGRKPRPEDALLGFGLARLCGARCAVLFQVPNQPLLDGKKEDDLIAETFTLYMKTGDESWPLLFPMVKSAVRAMDALQEWAKQEQKPSIKQFVVTGSSKRGWTTWLTAAVDSRIAAIAPMVINTLNMRVQIPNQLKVWGKYSEQLDDYTSRGMMERFETPENLRLLSMVDPYYYLDRITLPKLIINGTNDRYWTLDALSFYWNDLKGPKQVVYVPNAGHDLKENRNYALNGIGALFRHIATNRPMPAISWKNSAGEDGVLRLEINSLPTPKSAQLWVARSDSLDFREVRWESLPMRSNGLSFTGEVSKPEKGYIALLGDLEYEVDGLTYHLSTQVIQAGAKMMK
jgi:PhoPQ-activated pathogenicity-related protein